MVLHLPSPAELPRQTLQGLDRQGGLLIYSYFSFSFASLAFAHQGGSRRTVHDRDFYSMCELVLGMMPPPLNVRS